MDFYFILFHFISRSMWNADFSTVFAEFNLKKINYWERMFLNQMNFNVTVKASQYADYYFRLRILQPRFNRSRKGETKDSLPTIRSRETSKTSSISSEDEVKDKVNNDSR